MINLFKEIEVGSTENIVCLFTAVRENLTKNGSKYLIVSISDGEEIIDAKWWNHDLETLDIELKTVVLAAVEHQMFNDGSSYVIKGMEPGPADIPASDFVIKAPYDAEMMFKNIISIIRQECPDAGKGSLVQLTEKMYEDNKEKLLYWGAAERMHHNIYSGLLYHNLRMLVAARNISKVYAILDKELLLCAVALHDIGKIIEMETDDLGVSEFTTDGSLFGHLLLGIEMIDKEIYDHPDTYDPERIRLLKHCIASHHGKKEWDAIRIPSIPEALMLHKIDDIDARMYCFEQTLEQLEPGGMSDKIFMLDSRVYKPLGTTEEE